MTRVIGPVRAGLFRLFCRPFAAAAALSSREARGCGLRWPTSVDAARKLSKMATSTKFALHRDDSRAVSRRGSLLLLRLLTLQSCLVSVAAQTGGAGLLGILDPLFPEQAPGRPSTSLYTLMLVASLLFVECVYLTYLSFKKHFGDHEKLEGP